MSIEQNIKNTVDRLEKANHTNNNLDPEQTFYHLISAHNHILAALKICHAQWCEEYLSQHPAGKA